ncbi:MAG: hypothetical protein HYY67_08195 [Thaumarchaeota archaeon]|nr:hypothetical protein [Nitrososphaerota archaeon]
MKKRFLAVIGVIVVIAAGSLAYIIGLPTTNISSSTSQADRMGNVGSNSPEVKPPPNLMEVKKPIANVTDPNKEGLLSNSREPERGAALYIQVIYDPSLHPERYLQTPPAKPAQGVRVDAAPTNSTNDLILATRGKKEGGNYTFLSAYFEGFNYTTNSTGWVVISPLANAKYYLVFVHYSCEGPCPASTNLVPIDANQTKVITVRIPPPPAVPFHSKITVIREGDITRLTPSNITVKLGENRTLSVSLTIVNNDTMPHSFKLVLPSHGDKGGLDCGRDILPDQQCGVGFVASEEGKFPMFLDSESDIVGWLIVEP